MTFSITQLISIFVNLGVALIGVGLTILVIKLLGLKDKSAKLLFILYIVFWIAPLLTRDYTGLIQVHFDFRLTSGILLIIPIVCYGLIGVFVRPLSDLLSFKFKSRKTVIYISLGIQLCCALPMFFYPCLATNIVQSIGAGIGAGCIGLFSVMFNQHDIHRGNTTKLAATLIIPPIIAQFFASAFICIVVSFVKVSRVESEYVNIVKWLWLFAAIFIIAAFIITIFIKEKKETLYKKEAVKEVISDSKGWWYFIVICLIAVCISFIKAASGGAVASIQIAYEAKKITPAIDTRAFEGYASLASSVGQLLGVVASSAIIKRSKLKHRKLLCLIFATLIGIAYALTNTFVVNVIVFITTGLLTGLAYGVFTNIILSRILSLSFQSKKHIVVTPIGIYNTSLAIGIVFGSFANAWLKAGIFDQMNGFSTYSLSDFKVVNAYLNVIYIGFIILALVFYLIARRIRYKTGSVTKTTIKNQYAATAGNAEM